MRTDLAGGLVRWLVGVTAAAVLVAGHVGASSAAEPPPFERIGFLGAPAVDQAKPGYRWDIVAVDGLRQRLYSVVVGQDDTRSHLVVHDTSTRVPTYLGRSDEGIANPITYASPYKVAHDAVGNRLFVLDGLSSEPVLRVIDLDRLVVTSEAVVSTLVPGLAPAGIAIAPAGDRIYLTGTMTATQFATQVNAATATPVPQGAAPIVALDSTTLAPIWLAALDRCQSSLDTTNVGTMLAVRGAGDGLYLFCDNGAVFGTPAGQPGLVRLEFSPQANAEDVATFAARFFPVSGQFRLTDKDGIVGFDPGSERVFVQSLAPATPGAWVFDGRRDAWVGFIAAPDANNVGIGVNPENGRHYMVMRPVANVHDTSGSVNVTDGRATPIPQGELQPLDQQINSFVVADPGSNRVYASVNSFVDHNGRVTSVQPPAVFVDRSEPLAPLAPVDYDALTIDVPEGSSTRVTRSASAAGFGASYQLVGGVEGSYSAASGFFMLSSMDDPPSLNQAGVATGDRGIILARLGGEDLRAGGASASAGSVVIDQATEADRSDAQSDTGAGPALDFPYGTVTCLDGIGEPVDNSVEHAFGTGRARVSCDLAGQSASASASFQGAVAVDGLTIGPTSINSRTFRDGDNGIVSETTATVEAIRVAVPGAGGLSIDRVTTTSRSRAQGRPGTATSSWERHLTGVVLTDPSGAATAPQDCVTIVHSESGLSESGECRALVEQANTYLERRITIRLPLATAQATPKGAFAAVKKHQDHAINDLVVNNEDSPAVAGLQLLVTNDSIEKSRVFVQLAAVSADAIYAISLRPVGATDDASTIVIDRGQAWLAPDRVALPGAVAAAPVGAGGPGTVADAPDLAPVAAGEPTLVLARGWAITTRKPGDIVRFAALIAMVLLPAAGALRRRRLLSVLT